MALSLVLFVFKPQAASFCGTFGRAVSYRIVSCRNGGFSANMCLVPRLPVGEKVP